MMKKILLFVTIFLINLNLGAVENKKHILLADVFGVWKNRSTQLMGFYPLYQDIREVI